MERNWVVQNWLQEFNKFRPTHSKISKMCTLLDCFWPKYIMLQLTKYRRVMFYSTQDWKINLKENWFVVSKMTRIWWILIRALKSLTNLHFHWFLLCKVFNVWPKKYRGVIFHDTEEWCKIWRKTDLLLGKWHEEFSKFSPEH